MTLSLDPSVPWLFFIFYPHLCFWGFLASAPLSLQFKHVFMLHRWTLGLEDKRQLGSLLLEIHVA